MLKYSGLLVLLIPCAFSQSWSAILSPSRAIDWSKAGLPSSFPDGETTINPWTPPARLQCGPALTPSGGDDVAQIITAFNGGGSFSSCTPPYVVILGSGTFQVNSNLFLGGNSSRNNITLRGSGPMNTKVTVGSGGIIQTGSCCVGGGSGALTSSSSNYTAGQTSFLLQNVAGTPFAGAIAYFIQCDNGFTNTSLGHPLGTCTGSVSDPLTVFHCADTLCGNDPNSGVRTQDIQEVRITSATNTGGSNWTVTVSPGLYLSDWTYNQGATLAWDNQLSYTSIGVGIEDMTIKTFDSGSSVIIGNGGYASWIKGVREMGFNNQPILGVSDCSHCLVVNNYFFGNDPPSLQSGTSLIFQDSHGADNLFLNNLSDMGWMMDDGPSHQGIVVAYNYSLDSAVAADYQATLFEHGIGSQLQLRESNQLGRITDDNTYGTHNFETDFRNNLNCGDPPAYSFPSTTGGGFQYSSFARFANSVGNVVGFGLPSKCPTYQGSVNDGNVWNLNGGLNPDSSGLTVASLMRWGNVSAVTQSSDTPANSGIRFVSTEVPTNLATWPNSVAYQNSVPANNNLPCSFFLQGYSSTTCTPHYSGGTGLSWWKVCTSWTTFPTACASSVAPPFPANGPDVLASGGNTSNYANDIPAAVAWKNLPIDTSFQNSYTVTGSSWSSGTETLTVTTPIPVLGGFQLIGAPGACAPTSGVSYTGRADGEIITTYSTTMSVKYALAGNPGTPCTGTLKWPDVRKFDEVVYQNDPAIICTITITSPTSNAIVSGQTALTATTQSSCPSLNAGGTISYILNDFYVIATVKNAPTFSYTWSSAFVLDGPAQIKAVGYDATGAIVATSANVLFTLLNYGATCTVNFLKSGSGTVTWNTNPIITGNMTLDMSCTGITLREITAALDGIPILDGYVSGTYPTGANPIVINTATILNGTHLFSMVGQRTTPISDAFQLQFMFTVSNPAGTVVAVKPDITDVVLTVGGPACTIASVAAGGCGSYTLVPLVTKADGSTASSTFSFLAKGACNLAAVDNPDNVDMLCTVGNTFPATSANLNSVSLSASSGASTTITALTRGHTQLQITDNTSGKSTFVQVAIKSFTAPPHFAIDGTVRNSAGNDGKDIFRTSLFNIGANSFVGATGNDANWPAAILKSKFNSLETTFGINPYGFPNLGAWRTAWQTGGATTAYPEIASAMGLLPGLCLVVRGDGTWFDSGSGGGFGETVAGASSFWSPVPQTDALNYLKAKGINVCGYETVDEIFNQYASFNPVFSLSKADGTLTQVVVTGCPGACNARWTTAKVAGKNAQYGAYARYPSKNVALTGATSAGLPNGLLTVNTNQYWCGDWNLWLHNDCGAGGPNPGPLFTFGTTCPGCSNGTYTDAGMQILGWGDTSVFHVAAGNPPWPNNSFTIQHNQISAAGVCESYPNIADSDPIANMNYSRTGCAVTEYRTFGDAAFTQSATAQFFWGNSYREIFDSIFARTWGSMSSLGSTPGSGTPHNYWQTDQTGYVTWAQDVPHFMEESIDSFGYNVGGRTATPSMNGSCMTTSPLDGITGFQTNGPMPWIKVVIAGNSDSAMNKNWFAGLPCNNSQGHELFSTSGTITGCTPNNSGTVTLRGTPYTITSGVVGFKQTIYNVSGTVPADWAYGEHATVAGNAAGCNVTGALYVGTVPGVNGAIAVTNFANSTGTGGTATINDDAGFPNPSIDTILTSTRLQAPQPDALYLAGLGYAGIRDYSGDTQADQFANFGSAFPGSQLQTHLDAFINSNIDIQRRWRALAQVQMLLTRVAPFNFGDFLPSPYLGSPTTDGFAPDPDVISTAHVNSSLGVILSCVNFSEVASTITVPHSRYQSGTNPVSVYRISYPHLLTDLLTGTLTTGSFTLQPGESIVFLYHNSSSSFVQNASFSFTLPAGATQACIRYSYGYADPLPLSESIHSVCGTTSPLIVPLDPALADFYYQRLYLNGSNVIIGDAGLGGLSKIAHQ